MTREDQDRVLAKHEVTQLIADNGLDPGARS